MQDIKKLSLWQQNFGLLPIRLFPENKDENSYVLLNGGHGDFCLNTAKKFENEADYNSFSWSSNTKNFVVIDENVTIYNWKKNKAEIIKKNIVEDNLVKFHNYLLMNNYKTDEDITPFIIEIFKQFRNFTAEEKNAVDALNLLFLLLISLDENINDIDVDKWSLINKSTPPNFEDYLEKLKNGIPSVSVKPRLDLILRHASGVLFQEAHKRVLYFDNQINLFGTYSSKLELMKNSYSSIHYTPPYLSRTIVENALKGIDFNNKQSIKIFDPACGSSEFLIEVLKQLNQNDFKGSIELLGWDTSETAINTSKFLLSYEKRTIWKDQLNFSIRLVEDSLKEKWDSDYDLILMNPPFVSWEQMGDDNRGAVRDILKNNFQGRPNQASAFLCKAIQHLNSNGVIGCVIPSSILTLDSYKKIRSEIATLININLIGKLGNFVFEDALTDVSLIVGQKPKTDDVPFVLWTRNEKGIAQHALRDLRKMQYLSNQKIIENDFSIYRPSSFPIAKDYWKLISFQENEFLKKIDISVFENKLVRIKDIFTVKQGIRTGNNFAFKISKDDYCKLPNSEREFFRPALVNESINNCNLTDDVYIWYPYDKNGLSIKTEEELISKAPVFYQNNLLPHKDILSKRARKNIENWWALSEHRAWLRKKEIRLVSTEFGKSNSFALDKKGDYAVERGNAWILKKDAIKIEYYYFYLAIFSSTFFDKLLSIYSRQLLSGWDLGQKYTNDIPIPNVFSNDIQDLDISKQLVDFGKQLSMGDLNIRDDIDCILQKYFYPKY